jgi:hypothetical protein
MRALKQQKSLIYRSARQALAALLCLHLAAPAFADNQLDQTSAQAMNANLNHVASDQSLQHSTVLAMQALMDLASTDLKGAVSNGYNAYGRYRDSERLDRLTDINTNSAASMASIGAQGAVTGNVGPTNTTYRRLDPSFLRQGEAAKVAAEFEKRTGMSREDFLSQISTASEQKIKSSDPMMFDKALTRLEGFAAKIPNAQFRNAIEKNINLVPDSLRRGLVAKAVSQFAGMFAGAPAGSNVTDPNGAKQVAAGADGLRSPASAGAEGEKKPEDKDGLNLADVGALNPSPAGRDVNNPLDGVIQAALASSQKGGEAEDSIFKQVTRRYRIWTPKLSLRGNQTL